jgi:hypothetical protein
LSRRDGCDPILEIKLSRGDGWDPMLEIKLSRGDGWDPMLEIKLSRGDGWDPMLKVCTLKTSFILNGELPQNHACFIRTLYRYGS